MSSRSASIAIGRLLAPVACIAIAASLACSPSDRQPPDVVVITIDTLRPDHLGFLGYPRDTAPFLTELAERSVTFRRAFSTSTWTPPATVSLFTSLYPAQHGVLRGFFVAQRRSEREGATLRLRQIPPLAKTLPEVFREHGYRTFGIAANVNIGPEIGFDRGFDHFARLHELRRRSAAGGEEIVTKLLEWEPLLREEGPNFVYLHFNDPHQPYQRRQPWYTVDEEASELGRVEAAYDSEISYLDSALSDLLPRFGWDRDAILAVVSDHGEEFREHGRVGHDPTLYGELLRILMMIRFPGAEAASIDVNVSLIDVLPTLADLAGLDPLPSWQGRSLADLVRGGDGPLAEELENRAIYAQRGRNRNERWAVMLGDWKLIQRRRRLQLFHLEQDPFDQRDLSDGESEVRVRLVELLTRFQESGVISRDPSTELTLTPEELEQLRALGYVEASSGSAD